MIEVAGLSARVGRFALSDIGFTVPHGGYGVVIGPAGSGKTTLLECIAGIVSVRSGTVRLAGTDVTLYRPERRRLSLVYQHAYLFPHLTVRENVAYGAVSQAVADQLSDRFGLGAIGDRDVRVLSGGERQLVALARALAHEPDVLLLDEPFSALDPQNREAVRREVRTMYYERRFTVLHVTHDFAEAGMLGDVAILLDHGRVLQAGPPEQVFRHPATAYIASFLGAENVFGGEARPIRAAAPDWLESSPGGNAHMEQAVAFTTGKLTMYALGDVVPGRVHAVIRAEEIVLSPEAAASSVRNQFRGTVTGLAPAGALTRVTIDVSGTPLVAAVTTRSVQELGLRPGKDIVAAFKATSVHLC